MVLDSSALIAGLDPLALGEEYEVYTTPSVLAEVALSSDRRTRLSLAVELGKAVVAKPSAESLRAVESESAKTGDLSVLSPTDLEVLALAHQLRNGCEVVVVTDDFAIQNVAASLGLRAASLMTLGISKRFCWELFCPGCEKALPPSYRGKRCPICGTVLRRRRRA